MNLVAALLGFFVLKPVIKSRLALPRAPLATEPAFLEGGIAERRGVARP